MVEGDLAKAERLIAQKQWFEPAGDNAFETLRSAAQMPASAARVQQLTANLVQAVATEIVTLRKKGDNAGADELLSKARREMPDQAAFTQLMQPAKP